MTRMPTVLGLALAALTAVPAMAQESVQANNPLSNMSAFNIQNNYFGELTGVEEPANALNLRIVQPFQAFGVQWVMRGTFPVVSLPVGPGFDQVTGIGDSNVFALGLIDVGNPGITCGIGPGLTIPTATDDRLGGDAWNLGFANILFNASSPKLQWGYLLQDETTVAKAESSAKVAEKVAFQPFAFYQLGDGWLVRLTAIWTYDFRSDDFAIPIGLGVGKVRAGAPQSSIISSSRSTQWKAAGPGSRNGASTSA